MSDKSMSHENRDAVSLGREKVKNIAGGMRNSFKQASASIENKAEELGDSVSKTSRYVGRMIQDRVNSNPWMVIGGVGLATLIVGFLAGRRTSKAVQHP